VPFQKAVYIEIQRNNLSGSWTMFNY